MKQRQTLQIIAVNFRALKKTKNCLAAGQPLAVQELFALEEVVSKRRKALVFALTANCVLLGLRYFRTVTPW
jgi:hypothetical protein